MSKDKRRPFYDEKNASQSPGPGNYEHKPIAITGYGGYHIGQRFGLDEETRLRHAVPGPGSYS